MVGIYQADRWFQVGIDDWYGYMIMGVWERPGLTGWDNLISSMIPLGVHATALRVRMVILSLSL